MGAAQNKVKKHKLFGLMALLGAIVFLLMSLYCLFWFVIAFNKDSITFPDGLLAFYDQIYAPFLDENGNYLYSLNTEGFLSCVLWLPAIFVMAAAIRLLKADNGAHQIRRFTGVWATLYFLGACRYYGRMVMEAFYADGNLTWPEGLQSPLSDWFLYALLAVVLLCLIAEIFAKHKGVWKALMAIVLLLAAGAISYLLVHYGYDSLGFFEWVFVGFVAFAWLLSIAEVIRQPYPEKVEEAPLPEVSVAPLQPEIVLPSPDSLEAQLGLKVKALSGPYDDLVRYVNAIVAKYGENLFRAKIYEMLQRGQIYQGQYVLLLHIVDKKPDR
jgi:hypothetical protein